MLVGICPCRHHYRRTVTACGPYGSFHPSRRGGILIILEHPRSIRTARKGYARAGSLIILKGKCSKAKNDLGASSSRHKIRPKGLKYLRGQLCSMILQGVRKCRSCRQRQQTQPLAPLSGLLPSLRCFRPD